ncbi:hypothetical protein MED297_11650 [Reinekea sp. MED297]|uniref:Peptidase S54 rhomboid domain-containing protein n=2 Tax=Reinekea TaxID=230494 RepID=A4BB55_9GAMM|nr:hypothetical protein MED297_11650 [Reinekea sp. MED297] [Reinekea blandensis MED297]
MTVSYLVTGNVFGKVRIIDLEAYGGVTIEHLRNGEYWRLLMSQLVHSKPIHMLYNLLSLLLLGGVLERRVGSFRFLFVWFVGGAIGTVVSTFTVPAPWNLGTGGSQAVLSVAGLGVMLYALRVDRSRFLLGVLLFALAPALILDVLHSPSHLPKAGHVVSLMAGLLLGGLLLKFRRHRLV